MGSLDEADTVAPEALLELLPRLAAWKREGGIHLAVGDSLGYYGPHDRVLRGWGWRGRRERWGGCQAGMLAVGIESDGGVKGCLSIQGWREGERDLSLEGNLRERALADIWFDQQAFAYNRRFDPASLTGACARCVKARDCRGGARCVATAFTGGVSHDPYCWLQVAGHHEGSGVGRAVAKGAAAAMLLATLGLGGCEEEGQAVGPDYGVPPDARGEASAEVQPADAPDVLDVAPDAATDPCANVCCECDYGDPPPPECCPGPDVQQPDAQQPDVPDVAPDQAPADVPPTDVASDSAEASPDAPDANPLCANVCCECEYGVIPQEIWDACCKPTDPCANVCCECDYGDPPPPECCPGPDAQQPEVVEADVQQPDAQADTPQEATTKCEEVCCMCEYGIIPEDVWKECCEVCADVCCDCDYGDPPPPQCCP